MEAEKIIRILGLKPLGREGGFYSETYRSEDTVGKYLKKGSKEVCTAIYYLLTPETSSLLHSLPYDEIFHFYSGDPVMMLLLAPDGRSETVILGNDIDKGQRPQVVVKKYTWQGSFLISGGRFALMGTTMSPAYDQKDYIHGKKEELIKKYPDRRELISRLTG